MPQRVSVVRVSLGEGVHYVLDLTADVNVLRFTCGAPGLKLH
jgi:hypothetical protein